MIDDGDVRAHLLEGCQVIDFEYRYAYVNDAVLTHGRKTREELLGRTMMACYPGIEATPMFAVLVRCMTQRLHERLENEFTYPDGTTGWFELRFVPVAEGVCVLSLDITEQRRAARALAESQAQLHQAQKMEAVGRLAGGVAHDFNNLLTVILSYAGMAQADLPDDHPLRGDLDEIVTAAERAADLTRQLLAFSRPQPVAPRVLALDELIPELGKMIRRLIGEDVALRTVLAPGTGKIRLDPGQLEQILLNLAVNARDAMPGGGTLTIETRDVELDGSHAVHHLGVTPGPHVMIAVSDDGDGMDACTRARIFEPFFTTKPPGKGTGLGLSTVHGIVRQCGGTIWVYSEPGHGTTFKLYFPRFDGEPAAPRPALDVATLRGRETVLVVEDDDQLRAVSADILRRHGYVVLTAPDGDEALALAREHDGALDLLLADVVMPQMSGPELVRHLRARHDGLRVLFMSGYTRHALRRLPALGAEDGHLEKPFAPEMLLRTVREVLDTREAA
ncbi:MAG: response regulator [Kofleriaceae bacterium]|nr:response regulator [Kofleriaceae bacterium]MCL4226416.1 response regulator [Myxococcales bacterium]